ncbi:MAG: hypothetical protein IKV41_05320 [Oscillospiraceae bacterium]|nr:hypothetical protein [Oscillospiraceae bacterium]
MGAIMTKAVTRIVSIAMAFWFLTSYLQVINTNIKAETSGMLDNHNFFVVVGDVLEEI